MITRVPLGSNSSPNSAARRWRVSRTAWVVESNSAKSGIMEPVPQTRPLFEYHPYKPIMRRMCCTPVRFTAMNLANCDGCLLASTLWDMLNGHGFSFPRRPGCHPGAKATPPTTGGVPNLFGFGLLPPRPELLQQLLFHGPLHVPSPH